MSESGEEFDAAYWPAESKSARPSPAPRDLDAKFLETIRDYTAALLNAPGTPRHTRALNRVLEYVAGLHKRVGPDTARIDALECLLRPLPWGGVYALLESDGDSQFRITVQPSSGDAPFINETGADLRATLDAALHPEASDA